jgi:hypothetical protein
MPDHKRVNEVLVMLGLFIVAYLQLMIMLAELKALV